MDELEFLSQQTENPNENPAYELPQFTLGTPLIDILTKRSSFNPFPEKATQGIRVSRTASGPFINMQYVATGDIYSVRIPFTAGGADTQGPTMQNNLHGIDTRNWLTLEEFSYGISPELVQYEISKGDLDNNIIADASVHHYDELNNPIFEEPHAAWIKMYTNALKANAKGDWRTAGYLVTSYRNTGNYIIQGKEYTEPADANYYYRNQLGADILSTIAPSLDLSPIDFMSASDTNSNFGKAIDRYVSQAIFVKALETSLNRFSENPDAQERIQNTIDRTKQLMEQDKYIIKERLFYIKRAKDTSQSRHAPSETDIDAVDTLPLNDYLHQQGIDVSV